MRLRHRLFLLIGTAGCALAFVSLSLRTSGLGTIESAAPRYFAAVENAGIEFENETSMIALRRQATSALTQLRTKTAGNK